MSGYDRSVPYGTIHAAPLLGPTFPIPLSSSLPVPQPFPQTLKQPGCQRHAAAGIAAVKLL
jgi:hypothetical protein